MPPPPAVVDLARTTIVYQSTTEECLFKLSTGTYCLQAWPAGMAVRRERSRCLRFGNGAKTFLIQQSISVRHHDDNRLRLSLDYLVAL